MVQWIPLITGSLKKEELPTLMYAQTLTTSKIWGKKISVTQKKKLKFSFRFWREYKTDKSQLIILGTP